MQEYENRVPESQTGKGHYPESISHLNSEIALVKEELDGLVAQLPKSTKFWEELGLLSCPVKPKGLLWATNVELEILLGALSDRNHELLRLLSLDKEETCRQVDSIDELVVEVEVFDANWVSEVELRHVFDLRSTQLLDSQSQLNDQAESIAKFDKEGEEMIFARKRYSADLATETQSLLKHRAKLEDVYHQNGAFKTGLNLCRNKFSATLPMCILSERMRCSFNDLRRVNAGLEEKLVLTGVAKQRIMKELQILLVELRAQCSRDVSVRFRQLMDDPLFVLEDPNLSPNAIADINQVWKASMPTVPSLSGDPVHTDLVTWLSISCGHFCQEVIGDLTDILLSKKKDASSNYVESHLVGVLAAETHRYRSIAGSLRSVISDTMQNTRQDSNTRNSLSSVISEACIVAKTRLGCENVTFWITNGDSIGYTSNSTAPDVKCANHVDAFYSQSIRETCSLVGLEAEDFPPDLLALHSAGLISSKIDAFSVSSTKGGMTVTRNYRDSLDFPAFSGIYIEQFYRRILSNIAPLEAAEMERIVNQRPIDLVDSLFELRTCASSLPLFVTLVQKHLGKLFGVEKISISVPINPNMMWIEEGSSVVTPITPLVSGVIKSGHGNYEEKSFSRTFFRGRNIVWILFCSTNTPFNSNDQNQINILNSYTKLMEQMIPAWIGEKNNDDVPILLSFNFIDETEEEAIKRVVNT